MDPKYRPQYKTLILRILGLVLLADGLATLFFGREFVRLFRLGSRSNPIRRVAEWFLSWPAWLLRGGAALQAALGAAVLGRAPLDIQALYENTAQIYAALDPGWRTRFYRPAHTAFDRTVSRRLPEGGHVLDLGSGMGANLARLLDLNLNFGSYTGVDLTPGLVRLAAERYRHIPNARFLRLNLLEDPLPEGPFDLITSTWVFQHLPDPVQAAQKALERLQPGGHMILLLEMNTGSLRSHLAGLVYPFLGGRLVSEKDVLALPGVRTVQLFQGPLTDVVLVTIAKPEYAGASTHPDRRDSGQG